MAFDAAPRKDQSQVYLPINNALSEVGRLLAFQPPWYHDVPWDQPGCGRAMLCQGHVHLYLKEIGQGVQHIASRVEDLPTLVAGLEGSKVCGAVNLA